MSAESAQPSGSQYGSGRGHTSLWNSVDASNRRLSLAGLDPLAKALSLAGLTVLVLASAIAVFFAFGWTIPGGTDEVLLGGVASDVPRAATVLAYLALAVGAAIAVAAAAGLSGKWEWAVRGTVGFVGAAIAGLELQAARLLDANPLGFGTVGTLTHVCGWLAVLGAVVVAFTPPTYARRLQPLMIAAAASSALLTGALYILWPNVSGPPGVIGYSSHGVLALGVLSVIASLAIVVSIYVLWQAIVGIQAGRSGAMRLVKSVEGRPLLWLGGILLVKLAWLGCGYAGILPSALGGDSGSWGDSRHDGLSSWLLAVLFAAAALLALARLPLQRIDERGSRPVLVGLAASFSAFFVLGGIALLGYAVVGIFSDEGGLRSGLTDAIDWLTEGLLWSTVIAVFVAGAVGLGLLLFRRAWVGLPFLLVFVIWALPRALQATPGLSDEEPFRHLGVNVVTFDALLTVAIALLLIAWRWNRQRQLPPTELALVLGVSTLVASTPILLGSIDGDAYFYFALVFPAAYLLLFNARTLNREDPARRSRVLAAIGAASVLLTLVTLQVILGSAGPEHPSDGAIVQAVMAVPIAGVLTAASLASMRAADGPVPIHVGVGAQAALPSSAPSPGATPGR